MRPSRIFLKTSELSHMLEHPQKRLGVYYTPEWLADHLVSWALLRGIGRILDPSFGGCAILRAALRHLSQRVGTRGASLVYGFDIDPHARQYADQLIQAGVPAKNLI